MSGHSQFKNIMHRKGAQDAERAKAFAKLGREITVAAKSGLPDPNMNPRLRSAIAAARAQNMPKDNIERAIKKGSGSDADNYEEVRYEGYGPNGIAIIIEALTDNRNRTAPVIRSIFSKNGGTLGETNSVAFNFEKVGLIEYPANVASANDMFEAALEAGANDVTSDEDGHSIICTPDTLASVREVLEAKFKEPTTARFDWRPLNTVPVTTVEAAQKLYNMLQAFNDDDDVQRVYDNSDISEDILSKLE